MEKNYFAALDYRTEVVVSGVLFVTTILTISILGLFSGTVAGFMAALGPFSLILPALVLAKRLDFPYPSALCVPFMFPLFLFSVLNSTVVTLRQGGIRWRDTSYSLKALRAGNVK